ncbi:MAG TPA: glutamate--tRNA ligase family protein, partial [Polyangiaceae bacterium]|nr:glutamate--tRNA ligase family protein [Polyangiaceae bacterium]
RAASAPHPGEEGPVYPGTCRTLPVDRPFKRPPALRLRVTDAEIRFEDALQGASVSQVAHDAGDFVLRRGDGLFAYQLAVVVDDLAMGITEVVRGADLLSSTPRQVLIARLLGAEPPMFAHAPLVVSPDGSRLAKRARGVAVRHHREAGEDPRRLVATLARAIGLAGDHETLLRPQDLVDRFDWGRLRRGPVPIDPGPAIRSDQK